MTEPDQSHHEHNHSNSVFSGVYYFEDLDKSPIYFKRPSSNHDIFDFANEDGTSSWNTYNAAKYIASDVTAHSCIIFPSTLSHGVEKNISSKNRYSIAFNTWFEDNQSIGLDAQANKLYF